METFRIEHLTFTYPEQSKPVLSDIDFTVSSGDFITLIGPSGCGKTTLLRLLKPALAPSGTMTGTIYANGMPLCDMDFRTQTEQIGFVLQDPDNQIVTDKVWHELAFGLESLGCSTTEIRARVAEMASFFGITDWFSKSTSDLSGGQKQLLNLASVMVMQPSILILDEPTSQLDPIAAQEFLHTLARINAELGTTIILTEHRLEEAFPVSNRVILLDEGKILADSSPAAVGQAIYAMHHPMASALPTPMRVFTALSDETPPLTVRDGRIRLAQYAKSHELCAVSCSEHSLSNEMAVELKHVYFRYEKNAPDVLKNMNFSVPKGTFFALLGGNGTGKSTTLSLISAVLSPYRGNVLIQGKPPKSHKNLYHGLLGVLPQNPRALFVKKTVQEDLYTFLSDCNTPAEAEEKIHRIADLCAISHLLSRHPYDLSGGEQQRAALAKILLTEPEILLLDEPTKGMDAHFKQQFASILKKLTDQGKTIITVSHDIEFCAAHAHRCALVFDGSIVSEDTARQFFAGKSFYTTAANRMARTLLPQAVLAEDILGACGIQSSEGEKI